MQQFEELWTAIISLYETGERPATEELIKLVRLSAQLYFDQGQFDKTESLYRRALAITEQALGPQHPETNKNLSNLIRFYLDQGRNGQAEPLLQRELAFYEQVFGPEHPSTGVCLSNLANIYNEASQQCQAEPLYCRALAIFEQALGPEHHSTAIRLEDLGRLYYNQGKYRQAETLYRRALVIREQALGPEHSDTLESVSKLAMLFLHQGQYCQAEPLFRRAMEICEQALGPEHPDIAMSLSNMAKLYYHQGKFSQAEELIRRALAITEQVLGPEHSDTAEILNELAGISLAQGKHRQAKQLYCRALAIYEQTFGPEHPFTALILINLARVYRAQGEASHAMQLNQRGMLIAEKAIGAEHPVAATSINLLAEIYFDQGLYDQAVLLHRKALAFRVHALGPEHPDIATSMQNLAALYRAQKLYGQAEPMYLRALEIRKHAFGPEHPVTADSINGLANLFYDQGQYDQAELLCRQALRIHEQALGPEHPDTAMGLNSLGCIAYNLGQFCQAELFLQRALVIFEQGLGPEHLDVAMSRLNLALLYQDQGQYDQAGNQLKRGLHIQATCLRREVIKLPAAQRLALLQSKDSGKWLAFSLASLHPPSAELALWTRLNFHGLIQEIEQRQMQLRLLSGPHQDLAERLTFLVNKLASTTVPPEQRRQLQDEREDLERELLLVAPDLFIEAVEVADVAQALPAGALLIEFQRFIPLAGTGARGEPRYLALVLSANETVAQVDLGPAHQLEALIAQAMAATTGGLGDAAERWMEFSHAFLPPLLDALGTATRCFLSLDAELHRLPFHALPRPGQPGQLFADSIEISILSTGRDLLRAEQAVTSHQRSLVVANPRYDLRAGSCTDHQEGEDSSLKRRSRDLASSRRWEPLPGTDQEGRHVASLLEADLFTQADATTRALQRAAHPLVLHVATHGFFLPDQELEGPRQQFPSLEGADLLAHFRGEDPMLRSGLVFAGANHPEADPEDDGYLTALEATHLALQGTELVTLSACDTGRGDICTGEGVYGLQRALIVAGARSTLLSLWHVPDDATCAFMVRFYSLLKHGTGRAAALRQVQDEFRNHPNIVWRHPSYWAAWQLVGDSGPIEGL